MKWLPVIDKFDDEEGVDFGEVGQGFEIAVIEHEVFDSSAGFDEVRGLFVELFDGNVVETEFLYL